MPELFDDEARQPAPSEGVRILGAEEARHAADPASQPAPGVTSAPPAARFPLPARRGPEPQTPEARPQPAFLDRGDDPDVDARLDVGPAPAPEPRPTDGPASGPLALPHWTEPPTGEVPQIPRDDTDPGDEPRAWVTATGSQPRFRADATDWASDDFLHEDLKEDGGALGALAEDELPDHQEEFDAEVAARRPRRPTARPTARRPAPERAPGGPPPHDELATRVVTAIVLATVALVFFALGRAATAVFVSAVIALAALEFFQAVRRAGFQPAIVIGLLGSAAMVPIVYNEGERAFPLVGAIVLAFTMFWYLAKVVSARPVVNIGVTLLGFAYLGGLGGFAGLLLAHPDGTGVLLGVVICAIGYDAGGYFVGTRFGRRLLAPDVSPGKTVEGLAGGMLAAVVLGLVVSAVLSLHPWIVGSHGLLLGLVVACMAPLGDLCESMLKRDLGIKDFGTFLPGHGGALDRFDSMLFCLPAVYYLVVVLGLH